ncbi:MAG: phytoene desaturase family protein [bacterium]
MSPKQKKVIIVGAGPGGLTAGMILAHRGADVEFYEKESKPGGRNRGLELGEFKFDTGPTFLMLKYILDKMFEETGRDSTDYLEFKKLDPLYRLQFPNKRLIPTTDREKMRARIEETFPGNGAGFDKFMEKEKARFRRLMPCLQKEYSSLKAFLDPIFLKAAPYLSLGRSLFSNLGRYFDDEALKLAFTFQSKYLGMSPWECPALFTMLSYMEYEFGIYHVIGGLNQISEAMADIVEEEGGTVNYNSEVQEVICEGKNVEGVRLADGEEVFADEVIVNADFGYTIDNLLPAAQLKKWTPDKLKKKKFSCGTFMLYLGLDRKFEDLQHHNIIFADDYKNNVEEMFTHHRMTDDFSFYIQNASKTDPTLAPAGKSTFYVLVPVPNNTSGLDWEEKRESFRNKVIEKINEKTEIEDLERHIEVEKSITPDEWEGDYNVYIGAEFNLAHNFLQMLYFRPHNKFEDLNNLYLTGGGTHPGSGLPTIYESGRISANLISEKHDLPYQKPSFVPDEIIPD